MNTPYRNVSLLLGFPLLTRISNVSTKGIKCAKNRNKCGNKGKLAHQSSKRRETTPVQWNSEYTKHCKGD